MVEAEHMVTPNMANRVRGWRRIGIVVSVVWFIGFGGYVWSDSTRRNGDFYSSQLGMCKLILDTDNESRLRTPDENWAKYEKCRADAEKLFFFEADQLYKGIPIILGVDLATIAIGWALVWFVVFVVRWIRRGFASA
jgi:hypothetical protein